jgi:D-alanyl-lipoteichoic acid acyltransferase DltB (MBOAT superfamily)
MLFNSYSFIFLYFPTVMAGMFWLGGYSHRLAALWLGLASVAFYAIWNLPFVVLLLASIIFNYGAAYWIVCASHLNGAGSSKRTRNILVIAIAANLGLLGYFKYTNFFLSTSNQIFGTNIPLLEIILPLGISFFTFTQIAFLVDAYRGIARETSFIHYLLFVTYFPHLIAGPILHHKQMMPQFADPPTYRINSKHVATGLTIFVLGLSKKVLIADNLAGYATPIFNAAHEGQILTLLEAWIGALAYTLQLYFDFSGYSDMAIGLSLMLNVRLPLNFNSPYKATNIIEFWRRWHMTLSAFLRDYLYFSLGGNRKGTARRYANLIATMLLGGLWHGANWTFVAWGGLHGLYLVINHAWRAIKKRFGWHDSGRFTQIASGLLTFTAVVIAWVFFRADTFAAANSMLSSMFGLHELIPEKWVPSREALKIIVPSLILVWLFPNTQQLLGNYRTTWENVAKEKGLALTHQKLFRNWLIWEPSVFRAWVAGSLFLYCILNLTKVSEFLYFQF